MSRTLRWITIACAVFACAASHATAYGVDQTDLWGTPGESGWGIQLVQQGNTIFATMFVYGTDSKPTWYIATLLPNGAPFQFTGSVIATNGPYFGAPWNPAQVTGGAVGTMVFTAPQVAQGTLDYTVNGVSVSKSITRSTFVNDVLDGTYIGAAYLLTASGNCSAFPFSTAPQATVQVFDGDDDANRSMFFSTATDVCFVNHATRVQTGRFNRLSGAFLCEGGDHGTLTLSEARVGYADLAARIDYQSAGTGACRAIGGFAGVRN